MRTFLDGAILVDTTLASLCRPHGILLGLSWGAHGRDGAGRTAAAAQGRKLPQRLSREGRLLRPDQREGASRGAQARPLSLELDWTQSGVENKDPDAKVYVPSAQMGDAHDTLAVPVSCVPSRPDGSWDGVRERLRKFHCTHAGSAGWSHPPTCSADGRKAVKSHPRPET